MSAIIKVQMIAQMGLDLLCLEMEEGEFKEIYVACFHPSLPKSCFECFKNSV